jgi:hypothetical protein
LRDRKAEKINKKWKEKIKLNNEEKHKILIETRPDRVAQRKKEYDNKKKKYLLLVKQNEEKVQERENALKEITDKMRARSKEERNANKGKRDKKKVEHDAFLEKQKGIYQKEMDALVRERKELENVKADYEIRKKETVAAVKGKVMQYFKDNKDKLGIDTTEKEDISKFISRPSVKAVFDKFDVPLKYFFEFYSRSEHHIISNELELNMESMNK